MHHLEKVTGWQTLVCNAVTGAIVAASAVSLVDDTHLAKTRRRLRNGQKR
jgi:hypothetical protein